MLTQKSRVSCGEGSTIRDMLWFLTKTKAKKRDSTGNHVRGRKPFEKMSDHEDMVPGDPLASTVAILPDQLTDLCQ